MTELLRRAMEQAQHLPESEQDRLGMMLLTEMLDTVPVEEIDDAGLIELEKFAARSGVDDIAGLRPLEDALGEYHQHGRFLGV